jgi:diacylglycerol O-acyltransferase
MQRLSAHDASFLSLEDSGYPMHIGSVPLALHRPISADDPYFELSYHVRHTALPAPGGEVELRQLVGRVMGQRLDRARPLWELWLAENVADRRWALISKVHHALVDGVGGSELLSLVLDDRPGRCRAGLGPGRPSRPRPAPGWSPARSPTCSAGQAAGCSRKRRRAPSETVATSGRVITSRLRSPCHATLSAPER